MNDIYLTQNAQVNLWNVGIFAIEM